MFCCVLPVGVGSEAHPTRHFMFQVWGEGGGTHNIFLIMQIPQPANARSH